MKKSIENIIKDAEKIVICSGEGINNNWELYNGKRTARALKMRLTRERSGGDRHASAWISGGDDFAEHTFLKLDIDEECTTDIMTVFPDWYGEEA